MKISIIDFGAGNLLNVQRAVEYCGHQVNLCTTQEELLSADKIIFPGVGSFPHAVRNLRDNGLFEVIQEVSTQKPFLGICLGMQLLFSKGQEFEETKGLNLIPGDIVKLPTGSSEHPNVIPQIGWAEIDKRNASWENTILKDTPESNAFYFVHSYCAKPKDINTILASYHFGGEDITAAVQKDNIIGTQFHPEKSGGMGLQIIENFLRL
jgi:imidazole glycerol-phosphate synthase subunit HisH